MDKRRFKFISLCLILVLSLVLTGCTPKEQVRNDNVQKISNGTYFYQSNKHSNHIVDINDELKKLGNASNPYQGITYSRVDSNIVHVYLNGNPIPKLYEVLKVSAKLNDPLVDSFNANLTNEGYYVGNADANSYRSALNYALAGAFNQHNSLSKAQMYNNLTHATPYRPAFNKKVVQKVLHKVYDKMMLNSQN